MVEEALLEVQEALVELDLRLSFEANDERDAPHALRYMKVLTDFPSARVPHALERDGLLLAPSIRLMFSPATSHQYICLQPSPFRIISIDRVAQQLAARLPRLGARLGGAAVQFGDVFDER